MTLPLTHSGFRPFSAALILIAALTLSGCSWLKQSVNSDSKKAMTPPPPQAKIVQTADATWIDPQGNTAPQEKMIPEAPSENKDALARLNALERQIDDLSKDMSMLRPALTRLLDMQESMQRVIEAQQPGTGTAPAAPVATKPATSIPPPANLMQDNSREMNPVSTAAPEALVPAAKPAPAKTVPAQPKTSPGGTAVRQVRVGEHSDKTRLVLEVTAATEFQIDIDNNEKIMVVSLPKAASSPGEAKVGTSALVSSYSLMDNGQNGSQLVVQLKKAAQVKSTQTLSASGSTPARLVIDIAGM